MEKEIIDRIKSAAQITEVVQKYVDIHRKGSSYIGLCPFHDDKKPSFSVSPQKNICHCFSCGQGGDPVKFIELIEKTDYIGALTKLAEFYGIDTNSSYRPELTDGELAALKHRKRMHYTLDWLTQSFIDVLHSEKYGTEAMAYLKEKRGFTDEMIKTYRLGFSSTLNFYHVMNARDAQYGAKDLDDIKAIKVDPKSGKNIDFFTGRAIFPIENEKGEVVAFAGRSIDNQEPKYLNSANHELFNKSSILYGLPQAKQAIQEQKNVFIVEGYCDVVSLHQKGVKNVVGTCGTALNDDQHVKLLRRFVPVNDLTGQRTVTLMLDGDNAGLSGNIMAGKILLKAGFDVRIVKLPSDCKDPDDLCKTRTAQEVQEYITSNTQLFLKFYANYIKETFFADADADADKDRVEVLESILKILEKL